MRFSVLASDSSGNSCFVESGGTKVLIDAGLSCKLVKERLAEIGESLDGIHAACFTHDHDDHAHAAGTLFTRHKIPVYATYGTAEKFNDGAKTKTKPEWNIIAPGSDFTIGALTIHPFHIPHDPPEPVGFVVRDSSSALGFATDLGEIPEMVFRRLKSCNALLLEFNHDIPMLMNHPTRTWELKQRIRGRNGHLSNEQAAECLARLAGPHLRTLFLAHISGECNTHKLARSAADEALRSAGCSPRVILPSSSAMPLTEV